MPVHAYLLIAAALLAIIAAVVLETLEWDILFVVLLIVALCTAIFGLIEYAQ